VDRVGRQDEGHHVAPLYGTPQQLHGEPVPHHPTHDISGEPDLHAAVARRILIGRHGVNTAHGERDAVEEPPTPDELKVVPAHASWGWRKEKGGQEGG
jgi:hypothetical protein